MSLNTQDLHISSFKITFRAGQKHSVQLKCHRPGHIQMKTFRRLRNFSNNYINNQEGNLSHEKQLSEHRMQISFKSLPNFTLIVFI